MIKKNTIVPQTVEVFTPNGESMGYFNEFEFNDLRIQIKNAQIYGYHAEFEGQILVLDKDGRMGVWPKGFFDLFEEQMSQLL